MTVALFIGIYVILIALVFLMFRVLKNAVNKIDEESKRYYVEKLEEYDKIIDDKENKINDLNEEIKNKKVEAESIKSIVQNDGIDFDVNIVDILSRTKYQEDDFFKIEKKINENFNYDYEKIVKSFVEKIDFEKDYKFARKLRKKFTPEKIFKLKTLGEKELEEELSKMLDEKEFEIFMVYKNTHLKFNFDEYIIFLDELKALNDPHVIVYVGDRNVSFNDISKSVKTKYDANIYKGIKILFRNRMYDFSLNGRDL